jgi:hypothetical protein
MNHDRWIKSVLRNTAPLGDRRAGRDDDRRVATLNELRMDVRGR